MAEGGQLLPGSVTRHYRRGHLVLPGVLPGVTWSVTWCYLVLPGVLPGVTWVFILKSVFFLWSQNIRVSQTQTFGKDHFPPRDVTWAHACSRYLFTWPTLCLCIVIPLYDIPVISSRGEVEALMILNHYKVPAFGPLEVTPYWGELRLRHK